MVDALARKGDIGEDRKPGGKRLFTRDIYEKCRVKREGRIGHDKVEEISLFVTMPAAPDDGKSLRRRKGKELWQSQICGIPRYLEMCCA